MDLRSKQVGVVVHHINVSIQQYWEQLEVLQLQEPILFLHITNYESWFHCGGWQIHPKQLQ